MHVVDVENLVKIYGYPQRFLEGILGYKPDMPRLPRKMVRALDHLTLQIEEGEVFGLLGPNGSGKTTLIKLLLDIIRPTAGRIELMGKRPGNKAVKRQLGYLPEQPYFYYNMNSIELLQFYGRIYGIEYVTLQKRIREAIELVGLQGADRRALRSFSKGMLQRIGIAQALIAKPRIVFLDEPSTGLDPVGRKLVKDIISRLKKSGVSVFLNTHILSDVEDVSDRVAIINHGKLVRIGPVSQLTRSINRIDIRMREVTDEHVEALDGFTEEIERLSDRLLITVSGEDSVPEVIRRLANAGADIFEVKSKRDTLEDVFVREVTNPGNGGGKR